MSNPGAILIYFAVDSSQDLSAGVLTLGVDLVSFPGAGSYVPAPPADIAALRPPPAAGRARYWWSCLCGAGTPVPLADGLSTVYGQLAIGPQLLPLVWRVHTPASTP